MIPTLQIPGYAGPSQIDFSPLANLGNVYREANNRQTLAELGKGLANGTIDYRKAAGQLASTGNLNGVVSLLQLGEAKDKLARETAASDAFTRGLGSIYGNNANSNAIGQPAASIGPTVPNDSNALPGQAGMNLRLADLSQDFIQDNPGTYLSSGVRSPQQQAALYANRGNNPNPVAVPGTSRHETGNAVDIGGMTPEQRAMLPQYGLTQPVANDPPHVELAPGQQPYQVAGPPVAAPQAQAGAQPSSALGPRAMQLIGALSNPNLPAAQKEIAKTLLSTELDQSKMPDQVKQYVYAKAQDPSIGTYTEWLRDNKASGKTEVNINQTGEKEYEKQSAKDFAELNRKMIEGAQTSRMKLGMLTRMGSLLSDPNIYTGAGGEKVLAVKKLAKAAGIDVGDLGGPEAVQAIGNQLALELRNPAGGAGMPGAMSDKDREFLQSSVPGLGQTPQGNARILDYMKRVAQRSLDVERMRQDYVRRNKRLDEGFYQELETFSNAHPLFPEAEQAQSPAQDAPPVQGARKAPDGNFYVPDPNRPGKYLRVQ